ncbi:Bax inhibitor-1/YccA family protein [Frondihabitans peucedani]|uniref:Bax inhibitor-1/YccA family protein n=1 Tax=Frondihabitans peucedani TaxID=598626 RepID=A0ABP8E2K0_9MICO
MAHSNPGFSQSPAFSNDGRGLAAWQKSQAAAGQNVVNGGMTAEQLQAMYNSPSASPVDTDRMTYEDVIAKTVGAFAILVVMAAVGWFIPQLAIVGAIGGFVLAMVNIFKKRPSAALVLSYAALEGLFVGGISYFFDQRWPGIVPQAVFGTLGVFAITLALFASGKVRASKRATQIFLVAIVGYAAYTLVNLGLQFFNVGAASGTFGLSSVTLFGIPLGGIIGIVVVLLAAYSLVLDFTQIKVGVDRGAPRIFGWQAAFGLVVTIVWLYTEILRLLAIFRGNN